MNAISLANDIYYKKRLSTLFINTQSFVGKQLDLKLSACLCIHSPASTWPAPASLRSLWPTFATPLRTSMSSWTCLAMMGGLQPMLWLRSPKATRCQRGPFATLPTRLHLLGRSLPTKSSAVPGMGLWRSLASLTSWLWWRTWRPAMCQHPLPNTMFAHPCQMAHWLWNLPSSSFGQRRMNHSGMRLFLGWVSLVYYGLLFGEVFLCCHKSVGVLAELQLIRIIVRKPSSKTTMTDSILGESSEGGMHPIPKGHRKSQRQRNFVLTKPWPSLMKLWSRRSFSAHVPKTILG